MSRRGNCWDNAFAERFFHTLKVELIGMQLEKVLDTEVIERVKQLLIEESQIQAIAFVQNKLNLGLRNSKEILDLVEKYQNFNL